MKRKRLVSLLAGILLFAVTLFSFAACQKKEKVVIWTAWTEDQSDFYLTALKEKFPEIHIVHEYMNTNAIASKIINEGKHCTADIVYSEEYGYLEQCQEHFARLDDLDFSVYLPELVPPHRKYVPELKNSGCIILNVDVLKELNLPEPTSYTDLLDAKYKNLISMPSPLSSGTGYMFLKQLVNEWGEEEAFAYFRQLKDNILNFTSSGSGPVNALIQGEVAVGLGMTAQAVAEINDGVPLKIKFFQEGAPYSMCGGAILKKSDKRLPVKDVFRYMVETLTPEHNKFIFPEQIYKDFIAEAKGYPKDIRYGNMSGDTLQEKLRLLEKWNFA